MKKIIKKLLQSRVENDDDFKIKNVALSKRSYQYLETFGNKCFKRLIELSVATRLQRLDKVEKQKPKEREMNIDQQDLLSAITIIMPNSTFLHYCYYSITQSTLPPTAPTSPTTSPTTTTTTTTTTTPATTAETTETTTPSTATETTTATPTTATTETTETTGTTTPTTTTTTTTKNTSPSTTTVVPVPPQLFFTRSYVKYKIEKQSYAGNYKYSKCFTISLAALMDFIFTEIIDCVLFNILSINKRKNIIDIMDILKTIKFDEELNLFATCLYNGEPSEHSEFNENKTEFLVDVIKQLMVSRDKHKRFRIHRSSVFQEYNRYFKHTLKESYRDNRSVSVNTNVGKKVKVNYTLAKHNGRSTVKKYQRPIPPKKIEKDYYREEDEELYPDDTIDYTKDGLSKIYSDTLKDICRSKDLKVTGNKTMLIERLIEYKENKDKEELEAKEELEKQQGGDNQEGGKSKKKLKLVTKKLITVITKGDDGIFTVETKEIERQDTSQPSNNVYFDTDDEDYQDYSDNGTDGESFICGNYFSDSEIGSDDNCKGDNGKSLIYQYDFNKYYKDQLSKENQSDEMVKLFKKKSARWFWKNRKDVDDTQYKLEELVESDSEKIVAEKNIDEDEDEDEVDTDQEEEDDEKPVKDDDESADSADESDESDEDSADLFDYDACYDELLLADPTLKKYTPHNLFKNRHKLGLGDDSYEMFRK